MPVTDPYVFVLTDDDRRNIANADPENPFFDYLPYGFAFYSPIKDGWYFENITGGSFKVTGVSVGDPSLDQYYIEITVQDLETLGVFEIKNRYYDGKYTFKSVSQ